MSHSFTNINSNCHFELEEIEKILIQHPDVQEVVVIDRENQFGKKCRVAYIVSDLIPERLPYQSTCLVELEQNTMKLPTKNISTNGICLVEAKISWISPHPENICT